MCVYEYEKVETETQAETIAVDYTKKCEDEWINR